MVAFALSNLIGLVRQVLITRAFGTGSSIDAFYAASTYPDLIFSLVAGGALSSAFFIYGAALLYGYSGSFTLSAIDDAIRDSKQGLGLLLAGMMFRISDGPTGATTALLIAAGLTFLWGLTRR